MAFFDEIGKKLSDAGQGVAQSTKNFTDTTKLNSEISDREKKISQAFATLGRTYYENHKEDLQAESADQIAVITGLYEEIDQRREEIRRIKGVGVCPNCGAEIPQNAAFCASCGAPVVKAVLQTAPADGPMCPNCGAPIKPDNQFCNHCGARLEQGEQ